MADLSKSGIVEEVQAFKDAEVRQLTSEYGAAAAGRYRRSRRGVDQPPTAASS
ncbi:hypothetical protein [Kitasatospora sp. NPDC059817]|uniref:hypothetical protein n=1 Tax=Kitasatospora sp. NPDC059817 TaxID=3346961 RepID=UPI003665E22F